MPNKITQIKVLGTGCPTCHRLHELTIQAHKDLEIDQPVEYIQDIQKIIDLGLMTLPVLIIKDKIVIAGKIPE
ncbi:MAG: thioredoxin family protein [Candidatus Gracilibacteria bacterium]|jgi:small redox-active disulfide protein 2|nr:thioredoxin family protein [Candidatus Gracilibacteria bacterium]